LSASILGLRAQPLTTALIASWIVVFVIDATSGGYDLVGVGGLSPLERAYGIDSRRVAAGEWWRLITAAFVHFGVLHLALNAYALSIAGRFVESRLGSLRMGLIFLVALLGGGIGAYLSTIGQPTITAGASGGVMGLFGAMVVVSYPIASESAALARALPPIVLTLLAGFVTTAISNGGHIGGLVGGGLTSALLIARYPSAWLREARAGQELLAEAAKASTPDVSPVTTMTPEEFSRETRTLMPPQLAGSFAVGLVCGLFAIWTLARPFGVYGGERGVIEVPLALIGWAALVFGLVSVATGLRGRIVLSPAGFAYKGWRTEDRVSWSELAELVTRKPSRYSSRTELVYSVVPARAFARRGWFGSFPDARPKVMSLLFGLKADDQRALIETWRARWADLRVPWPDQAASEPSSGLRTWA
jgi:membrane associated rhomboid family serine protease